MVCTGCAGELTPFLVAVEIDESNPPKRNQNAELPSQTLMISETTGPWDNQAQRRLEMSLMNLSCSSLRMWRAVMLQGNTIQRLALVNVSFLDLKGVAAMVNACPKLSTLEVARCEQVRHSMLAPFLRQCIIPTQKQRGSEIHCDISPHFERGSPYKNFIATDSNHVRSVFRQGTFGVTYNDSGIKIPVAVAGWLIYHDTLDAIYGKYQTQRNLTASPLT